MPMPPIIKISTTVWYLSNARACAAKQYIFLRGRPQALIRALELIGLALIAGTAYAYLGLIAQRDPAGWPVFWACAAGALAIIIYRRRARGAQKA